MQQFVQQPQQFHSQLQQQQQQQLQPQQFISQNQFANDLNNFNPSLQQNLPQNVPTLLQQQQQPQSYLSNPSFQSNLSNLYSSNSNLFSSSPANPPFQDQSAPKLFFESKKAPESSNIIVYNLPLEFKESNLLSYFSRFGNILSVKVFVDPNSNGQQSFAFFSFDNVNAAQFAVSSMNGFLLGNKVLRVEFNFGN